jgi:hypothetical protein
MPVRRFAYVTPALAALLLSGCIGSSVLDSSSAPVFLPALETPAYDSLGGGKIAFQRFGTLAGSFQGMYVIDASIPVPRTQSLLANRALDRGQLSPDGTRLLFGGATNIDVTPFDVFIVKLSDSSETRITSGVANEEGPSWQADGTKIFYHIRGNGQTTLFRQNPVAGSTRDSIVLVDSGGYAWNVDSPLSPNATARLTFNAISQGSHVWGVNIDGTSRAVIRADTAVPNGPVLQSPTWSPDGLKIAFLHLNYDVTGRVTSTQLKTMNPDGTGEVLVATVGTPGTLFQSNSLTDFSVCYVGATGTRIAFTSLGADGTSHVYVVRATGGPITQITTNSGVWDRGVSCKH